MSDIRNTIPQPGTYGIRLTSRITWSRSTQPILLRCFLVWLVPVEPGLGHCCMVLVCLYIGSQGMQNGPQIGSEDSSPPCFAASLCGSSPWNPVLATAAW